MLLDSAGRQVQACRDFLVSHALGQERQDVRLPGGQLEACVAVVRLRCAAPPRRGAGQAQQRAARSRERLVPAVLEVCLRVGEPSGGVAPAVRQGGLAGVAAVEGADGRDLGEGRVALFEQDRGPFAVAGAPGDDRLGDAETRVLVDVIGGNPVAPLNQLARRRRL